MFGWNKNSWKEHYPPLQLFLAIAQNKIATPFTVLKEKSNICKYFWWHRNHSFRSRVQRFPAYRHVFLFLPWLSCGPIEGLSLCPAHLRMPRKSETLPSMISPTTLRPARQYSPDQTGWTQVEIDQDLYYLYLYLYLYLPYQTGWTFAGRDRRGWSKERPSVESLKAAFLSTHLQKNWNGFH